MTETIKQSEKASKVAEYLRDLLSSPIPPKRPDHIPGLTKMVIVRRALFYEDFDYSDFEHGGSCTLLGC